MDFEFIHPEGELPRPLCLVAWELRSGQKIRLWKDRFGRNPPYSIAADSLFVSYAADAELGCHLVLGWPTPERVLDLLVEFRRAINTTPVHPVFKEPSLLKALTYYGLDGVSVGGKTYWRDVIMRGEPYTEEEQNGILDYCETDVVALARLLPVMVSRSHIDLPRALLRGRYMPAIARMQAVGVPIDMDRFDRLRPQWESIKEQLVTRLGSEYGVYDEKGSFSEKRFARHLRRKGWGWPLHEDGRMDLKDKTFKAMATIHPELEPLRQLRYSRDKLKLNELAVGQDGFNRCWLNPFGSRTSRNQPSNKKFIFGPAVWLRDFLIRPKEGWGLAYIDWISQEVGVLAGLSRDPAMMEAYNSEDFYITFGIQANLLPPVQRARPTKQNEIHSKLWDWQRNMELVHDLWPNVSISRISWAANSWPVIAESIRKDGIGRIIEYAEPSPTANRKRSLAGLTDLKIRRRLIRSETFSCRETQQR